MIASFFAGVGGIDLAFQQAGFDTVYANEFDKYAAETFELNFNIKVDKRDINDVDVNDIPEFDVLIGGFPCQAFSIAGLRQGFKDDKGRGGLFFQVIRVLEIRRAKVVFLENVKNLVGHDEGNTFRIIINELERLGYHVKYQVMNAMHYGDIPQNRERIYIVAFQDINSYRRFEFPKPIKLEKHLKDVIEFDKVQNAKFYYTEEKCSFIICWLRK